MRDGSKNSDAEFSSSVILIQSFDSNIIYTE